MKTFKALHPREKIGGSSEEERLWKVCQYMATLLEAEAKEARNDWLVSTAESVGNSQWATRLDGYAKLLRELADE